MLRHSVSSKEDFMVTNIGSNDRLIRAVLGLFILSAGLYFESYWGLIGLIPLATAVLRWCPAYLPFHISTVGKKSGAVGK